MSVSNIISNANSRVDAAVAEAQDFIDQLTDIATDESLGFSSTGNWRLTPWMNLASGISIPEAEVLSYTSPVLRTLDLDTVTAPDDPSTDQPDVWASVPVPDFTDEPLPLVIPDVPTTPVPTAPEDPSIKDISLSDWADYAFPDDPARTESAFPEVPDVLLDPTDMTLPDLDELGVTAPNNDFEYVENEYSSELKSALDTLLLSDLQDGGYGINPDDEQKLWDRARDRQAKLNAAEVAKARDNIVSKNFPLPPGAWYAAEQKVEMEGAAALGDANREIALKRSDNYVQARQFAVQQGISLEGALLNYTAAKWERALKAATTAADFVLQYHNASAQLVSLRIDIRRLYVQLHQEQRESVLTSLEKFRGQLALLDAEEGRNEGRLKLFAALREVVMNRYEILGLLDRHTMLDAEIEKLKLEQSKVRADLFATKVRARSDEFDAYGKAIDGERLKVELFDSQVRAHGHQVDSAVAEAKMLEARFGAELNLKMEERERIKIQLARMSQQVQQNIAKVNVDDQHNKELIEMWIKQLATQQFNVSTKLQRDTEDVTSYLKALSVDTDRMKGVLAGVNNFKELKASAAKSGVQLYETMIAGSESALSAVASITEAG